MTIIKKIFIHLKPIELLALVSSLLMLIIVFYYGPSVFFLNLGMYFLAWIILLLAGCISVIWSIRFSFGPSPKNISFLNINKIIEVIRDWLPMILVIGIYGNLALIQDIFPFSDKDWLLISIDKFIFFGHHPTLLLEKIVSPFLTEWFSFTYGTYLLYFPITLGLFYFQKKYKPFHDLALALSIAACLGFIGYLLIPAIGPFYSHAELYSINLQGLTITKINQQIDTLRFTRDIFPSLHIAMSTIFLIFAYRHSRKLFILYLPFMTSLWISTLYLRYHYVIDIIAGFCLAILVIYLAPKINSFWEKKYKLRND